MVLVFQVIARILCGIVIVNMAATILSESNPNQLVMRFLLAQNGFLCQCSRCCAEEKKISSEP